MPPQQADRFRSCLLEWATDALRSFPWREPDRSFYEVFLAEFFLTQTPAENVAEVYPSFVERFPDLEAVDEAGESELVAAIEPLGFQNMRATALNQIAACHDELPRTREELLSLPRVGEYVTDTTLCFAFGERRPILDRNVRRVYDRVFGEDWPTSPEEQRQFALSMLPEDRDVARTYNLALLDFGALVCTKRDPSCRSCFASAFCTYYQNSQRRDGRHSSG